MKFHQRLFQDIKEKNVTDRQMDGRTDNVKTVYPPTNTGFFFFWGGGGGYNYNYIHATCNYEI